MRNGSCLLVAAFLLASFPADASNLERKLDQSFKAAEQWTKDTFGRFRRNSEEALSELEQRLEKAKKTTKKETREGLDRVEKKLREIRRKLDEMDREPEPSKEKAKEVQADLKAVSKELE